MLAFLLLVAQSGDSALREAEAKRVAARKPLTESERSAYLRLPAGKAAASRTALSLAIIPVSLSDAAARPGHLLEDVRKYYGTASAGRFALVGRNYASVKLGVARGDLMKAGVRSDAEREALRAVLTAWLSETKGGLAAHDAVVFVPAGAIGPRGSALWPHEGVLDWEGEAVRYLVIPAECGARAAGIAAHEVGHLLDLQDKYEVGPACLMGTGYDADPPAPFCAVCRLRLGWAAAAWADPESERKITFGPADVLGVRVTRSGSESLLLELRGASVLVWRAAETSRPELAAALPTKTSDRLTPFSEPPFVGRNAGAREVWITDVRVEAGRAYIVVGPSAAPTAIEMERRKRIGRPLDK